MNQIKLFFSYLSTLIRFSPVQFFLGCVLNILSAVLSGAGLLMLIPLLHYTGWLPVQSQSGLIGGVLKHLPNLHGRMPLLATLALFIILIAAVNGLEYWRQSLTARLRLSFLFDLQQRLNTAIAQSKWSYILTRKLQYAHHMITVGQNQIAALTQYSLMMISDGILLLVYLSFSLAISFRLTLVTSITALALLLLFSRSKALLTGQQSFMTNRRLQERLAQFLDGVKLAKAYNQTDAYVVRFDQLLKEEQVHQIAFLQTQNISRAVFNVIAAVLFCLSFFIAIQFLHLQIATLIVVLIIFSRLMPRVSNLLQTYLRVINLVPVFDEMRKMLTEFKTHFDSGDSAKAPHLSKEIELVDVSFMHPGGTAGLHKITCQLPAFTTTAIIGPSGAGKTTLADILLGLLIPQSGILRVDGIDLNDDQMHDWRSGIGYVPQEIYLFNDTLRANLIWADPAANETRIWEALTIAAADEFVRKLPLGLETMLGDKGSHLSGGERQRLALARALLRQPKILLLDEATNALDVQNEELIYDALKRLHGKITIIIITHRQSTLKLADQVLELADGKLVRPLAP